jgi:tRNA threonylcarbamoyladenosine biosynthesis protein TsaB
LSVAVIVILAIDTATRLISVALADEVGVVAESTWQSANNHTTELAPTVERMLSRIQPATTLTAIAVAIGPGSFTGVRIGLGLAKGMALAQGLPLIGVRTFEIAARALPLEEGEAIAVLQAGRGRVIWARCSVRDGQWVAADDGAVGTWADVAGAATETEMRQRIVVGEIDRLGYEELQGGRVRCASPAQNIRRASHLAEIGWERLRRGATDSAAALKPVYAHQPVSGTV